MYYHQQVSVANTTQLTWVAMSSDGLNFATLQQQLGRPYFRVFKYKVRLHSFA